MASAWLRWLWTTDGGLAVRIAIGGAILAALAVADLRRNRRRATRWKEYAFLLAGTAAAMAYALANDMVTVTISPLYFQVHEGLEAMPDSIRAVAAGVALKGAWSAGLILSVAMLIANNPRKGSPRLPQRRMYVKFAWPLAGAVAMSAALGVMAQAGWLGGAGVADGQLRRFLIVARIHLGVYIGGAVGTVAAVVAILRERRKMGATMSEGEEEGGRADRR
ncbi:MAG TPA: hypothetical protein VFJ30_13095 [Phycisphaerae bacterium]|nr:hypothetical protein [Phycisphaerae bacterium]